MKLMVRKMDLTLIMPRIIMVFHASSLYIQRRSPTRQNLLSTAPLLRTGPPPQPPLSMPSFRGNKSPPATCSAAVENPPNKPIPKAAAVFPKAKGNPRVAIVSKNICGSIKGEASQNAMTGAKGTPIIKRAAIKGIPPQEQKGERAPNKAAANTI